MLEIKNLQITHSGGVIAATNFCLQASEGEVVVLAGAIGSGKSSILRAIAGLVAYDGDISLGARSLKGVPIKDRNFAYASFDSPIFGQKTVRFNLAYGLVLRRFDQEAIKQKVAELAERFLLKDVLDKKAKLLDANQRRLLIIARAFARDADIYLFNDITRELDDNACSTLMHMICQQFATKKAIMLLSVSDYGQLGGRNLRTIMLRHGQIVGEGDANYFAHTPPNIYSALFTNCRLRLASGTYEVDKITTQHQAWQLKNYFPAFKDGTNAWGNVLIAWENDQKILVFCAHSYKLVAAFIRKG